MYHGVIFLFYCDIMTSDANIREAICYRVSALNVHKHRPAALTDLRVGLFRCQRRNISLPTSSAMIEGVLCPAKP